MRLEHVHRRAARIDKQPFGGLFQIRVFAGDGEPAPFHIEKSDGHDIAMLEQIARDPIQAGDIGATSGVWLDIPSVRMISSDCSESRESRAFRLSEMTSQQVTPIAKARIPMKLATSFCWSPDRRCCGAAAPARVEEFEILAGAASMERPASAS